MCGIKLFELVIHKQYRADVERDEWEMEMVDIKA